MKRFWIFLALAAGCSREPVAGTATIAPAEPRPAATVTHTMGDLRAVTTSGSPVPSSAVAPGTETITIDGTGFVVRPLLARAHTAFHVVNHTDAAHDLVLRGPSGSAAGNVPARGKAILQLVLRDAEYELVCTTPGHSERGRVRTYVPGQPIPKPTT